MIVNFFIVAEMYDKIYDKMFILFVGVRFYLFSEIIYLVKLLFDISVIYDIFDR